jgi:hypothetical protein
MYWHSGSTGAAAADVLYVMSGCTTGSIAVWLADMGPWKAHSMQSASGVLSGLASCGVRRLSGCASSHLDRRQSAVSVGPTVRCGLTGEGVTLNHVRPELAIR